MRALTCDVCRKNLDDLVVGRDYFHILGRDLCEKCSDGVAANIKPTVRTKQPFSYDWYSKLVVENVEKAISKGKV